MRRLSCFSETKTISSKLWMELWDMKQASFYYILYLIFNLIICTNLINKNVLTFQICLTSQSRLVLCLLTVMILFILSCFWYILFIYFFYCFLLSFFLNEEAVTPTFAPGINKIFLSLILNIQDQYQSNVGQSFRKREEFLVLFF